MTVAGNDAFVVKLRNDGERPAVKVGDTVTIGWQAADCRALDPIDT